MIDNERFTWQGLDIEWLSDKDESEEQELIEPETVKTFKADTPNPRDESERRLLRALEELFAGLAPDITDRLARGEMPSDQELSDALSRVIEPALVEAASAEFERLGVSVGVQFDPLLANQALAEWAASYTYTLIKDLTDNTRKTLQTAMSKFQSTPGMTRGELEKLISVAFSPSRASAITVTEVTRAFSIGQLQYQQELQGVGITLSRFWATAADDLTCPICRPLNRQPEKAWIERFPDGPPAHVRCRCAVYLRAEPEAT